MANPEINVDNEPVGLVKEGAPDVWIDIYNKDGKLEQVELKDDETVHGFDEAGIELEVKLLKRAQKNEGRYYWRYKKDDGSWDGYIGTYHSPTEKVNDKIKSSPTIAQAIKAAGVWRTRHMHISYAELWRLFGNK